MGKQKALVGSRYGGVSYTCTLSVVERILYIKANFISIYLHMGEQMVDKRDVYGSARVRCSANLAGKKTPAGVSALVHAEYPRCKTPDYRQKSAVVLR